LAIGGGHAAIETKPKGINDKFAAYWLRALADRMNVRPPEEAHIVKKLFVLGESAEPFLRRIADAIEKNDWVRGSEKLMPAQRLRIGAVAFHIDHRPPGLSVSKACELAGRQLAQDWGLDRDAEDHIVGQIIEARKHRAHRAREQGRAARMQLPKRPAGAAEKKRSGK
jgi:hypothetical protein